MGHDQLPLKPAFGFPPRTSGLQLAPQSPSKCTFAGSRSCRQRSAERLHIENHETAAAPKYFFPHSCSMVVGHVRDTGMLSRTHIGWLPEQRKRQLETQLGNLFRSAATYQPGRAPSAAECWKGLRVRRRPPAPHHRPWQCRCRTTPVFAHMNRQ